MTWHQHGDVGEEFGYPLLRASLIGLVQPCMLFLGVFQAAAERFQNSSFSESCSLEKMEEMQGG